MKMELKDEKSKELQRQDRKKSKLLQAFENNLKISGLGLHDKYDSFEA